jgi:hypothetical protein
MSNYKYLSLKIPNFKIPNLKKPNFKHILKLLLNIYIKPAATPPRGL